MRFTRDTAGRMPATFLWLCFAVASVGPASAQGKPAEPVAPAPAVRQTQGQRILERYGMSEAVIITTNPLKGERIAGSVGYALPGVDLRVRSMQA